ncbi:MAG: DUF262 domain-containing protein [Methanobrevibacter sp.]|jgi:hypothetical protein|nr:DUF262 domain-containing protein [Candidatus Methanovirga basalitermitum]
MQIRTLIDDIKKLSEDKVHYFGVMYLGNDVSVGNDELSPIMDGQQRFITILLILQALKYSEKLPTIYLYDTYKKNTIMLFPEFEKDFDNLGKEYKKKINENKRIIEKEISSLSDEVKCNLISRILNNLNMIVVKCKDSAIETEIFQNLNAKGKKLDEIDNIKTHILAEHVKLGLEFREN